MDQRLESMDRLLLLLHTETDGSLGKPALETLTAASLCRASGNSQLLVGLVGHDVGVAANQIGSCGAERFLGVAGAEFADGRYASDAAAAECLCRAAQATIVIAPGTARWNRVLAGVAQRIGGGIDTHVTALKPESGKLTVQRWFYRQRMEACLQRTQRPWFILCDPGTHDVWQGPSGDAAVELLPLALPEGCRRTRVIGVREPAAEAQTIRPDAHLLLVAGAGWTKKQADGQSHVREAEKLILGFLKQTRASLGSTKSLVDLSGEGQAVLPFLTHLNQVGQTGSTPRHAKGLATCCHGEEPHTVGWRFISERRAISLDPNCGWARGKTDVLYVADAFAVIEKLNRLLTSGSSV